MLGLGAVALATAGIGIPWLPIWGFYGASVMGLVGVVIGADALSELDAARPLRWRRR